MVKNKDYKKSVTRQITFPKKLMDTVESRAKDFGYSFPQYVRYVLTKEVEGQIKNEEEIVLSEDFVKGIKESIKEVDDGKAVTLKTKKEVRDYFTSLMDE
jgi:hypothetical protein